MKIWKTISSKYALDSKWFKVRQDTVELPNGKVMDDYYVWESADSCMIVPVTKDLEVILVKQYKHGRGEIITEYPAGYTDPNEEITTTAVRELKEETGYTSSKLSVLGKLTQNPTKQTGDIYVVLAENVEKVNASGGDETENIEILKVPLTKVIEMIQTGEIRTTTAVSSTYLVTKKLGLNI